jgi:hypothetical protein
MITSTSRFEYIDNAISDCFSITRKKGYETIKIKDFENKIKSVPLYAVFFIKKTVNNHKIRIL